MNDRYFWTTDHSVLVIHSDNDIFKNEENLTELSSNEIKTYLNPVETTVTLDMINTITQVLTDSTANDRVNGGFKDMNDAYSWASLHQDPQALSLVKWDKYCWDTVDTLAIPYPTNLDEWVRTLSYTTWTNKQ